MEELKKYEDQIKKICAQHQVEALYAFGSVDTPRFHESSDIDLLVKFKPIEVSLYFDNYLAFKGKMERMFQRNVDLLEAQTLRNPVLIRSIERTKRQIYG
jgi:predicted nucleotidyltransferase